MKRLAALITVAVLSFACTLSLHAQSPIIDEANAKHAEKAQKQHEKEMKNVPKRQAKAMKKTEKARRKAMERAQKRANQ